MRRTIVSMSVLSLVLVAGLGCKHVGGKSDCHAHPDNAEIAVGGGGSTYPTIGAPIGGTGIPEKLAAPVEKAK
ncbi:hypothetical protein BH11PLA2_BH11PLA2_34180 [soil metagenome]